MFSLNLQVADRHGRHHVLNSNMAGIRKRLKGLLPLLVLAAVSLRVLTGAAEAQVNFTSLVIDEYKSPTNQVDQLALLSGLEASNPSDASSIPDKLKTFATYKKYLTPESAIQLPSNPPYVPLLVADIGANHFHSYSQKVIYQPTSHSPPTLMPSLLFTYTTSTVESVNLENYFGEIEIYNSIGGIGRL